MSLSAQQRKEIRIKIFNLANLISYSRILLAFLSVYFLITHKITLQITALVLIILFFISDALDGYVARKYCKSNTSPLGGVVDVVSDRIAENILWISFAYVKLVPLWLPLIVITRGFITDGVRSYALKKGKTTFEMMKSKFGKLIVSSRFSRGLYAVMKAISFLLLASLYIIKTNTFNFLSTTMINYFAIFTINLAILTVIFCLARGILTLHDSKELFLED
jgi:CDP-diacylglycerol---glycerol-3-phosphate 3-phosphatidyltransferase